MKLINQSKWDTRDLRSVILNVLNRWNVNEARKVSKDRLRVTITQHRKYDGSGCSGSAYVGHPVMFLYVPYGDKIDSLDFAHTVNHEIAHCAGFTHKNMKGTLFNRPRNGTPEERREVMLGQFPFMRGFEIRAKPVKTEKPKPDVQAVRYQRVVAGIARWSTKLKRAQTALKKLNQQRRYYERALAAKGREG